MIRKASLAFFLYIVTGLFSSLSAQNTVISVAEYSEFYSVNIVIYQDDKVIGMPATTVRLGEPASITADGAYSLSFTLSAGDSADLEAAFPGLPTEKAAGKLLLKSALLLPVEGKWKRLAEPTILASPSRQSSVSVDVSDEFVLSSTDGGYVENIQISFIAAPSPAPL